MEDFKYSELLGDGQSQDIRLVEIHPGTNGPLKCTLLHVSLQNPPVYEAISYSWDGENPSMAIICNGSGLQITPNLHAALLQLRNSTQRRTVWADAICINQTNESEKEVQVLAMRDIYQKATRVLIWLGESRDDSHVAMVFIRELFERVDLSQPITSKNALKNIMGDQKHSWSAVGRLLKRTWFQRVWVIQEAAVPSTAIVLCGADELPWEALVILVMYSFKTIDYQNLPISGYTGVFAINTARAALANSVPLGLLDILAATRGFCASNAKDKLYAILGLCHNTERDDLLIMPDYSINSTEFAVYKSFAVTYLRERADLTLLFHAGETEATRAGKMPSWVPDWSVTDYRVPLIDESAAEYPHYKATANSVPSIEFGHSGTLSLSGHVCDTIAALGSEMPNLTNAVLSKTESGQLIRLQYGILLEWEKIVNSCSSKLHPSGVTISNAFHHTILGGYVGSAGQEGQPVSTELEYMTWTMYMVKILHTLHLDVFPAVLTLTKDLAQFMKPGIWGSDKSQERYYSMCLSLGRAVSKQRIMVSKDGYIGVVPAASSVGDRISLIKGAKLPFILRENAEKGTWRLIGCCYIHGMMHGERFEEDKYKTILLE